MSEIEDHGDWIIWHDPLPVEWRGADWHYARKVIGPHAEPELNHGSAQSRAMCLQIIDHIEDSETPEAEARVVARSAEFLDRYRNITLVRQLGGGLNAARSILAAGGRGFADNLLRSQMDTALLAFNDWSRDEEGSSTPSPVSPDKGKVD